ncbi:MAG: aminotransferase class III-fold pyridoxal phosphate-dependent enzyme [Alphaproteobacteria bacterium]
MEQPFEITTNTLDNFWIPFTGNRDFKKAPRFLAKGDGMYYRKEDGEKIIDASSGLFTCALGHGRMEIVDAIYETLKTLDYSSNFNVAHRGGFEVASRLSRILPEGLNRVFFGNSGSEAIESAIKIVMAYNRARGQGHKIRYVSRERAYHGVNLTGVALSGMINNRKMFASGGPDVSLLRHTHLPDHQFVKGQPETGAELAEDLQRMCDNYGAENLAAVFIEPIAGSTGTLVPPKGYLERIRAICDANDILLVFDEVITGFGRTGEAFAAQEFGVTPDIMTMAKALTNGVQPMGATAVKQEIYDTIVESGADPRVVEFFHGYTYSAHPGACAAALATLKIYEEEDVFAQSKSMRDYFLDGLFSLSDIPGVTNIRGYGMMGGIDVAAAEKPGIRGIEMTKVLWDLGLHIKFTGDCGIVAPPLVAQKQHIDEMIEKFSKAFKTI